MQSLLWQHTTPKAFLLRKFNLKLKSKICTIPTQFNHFLKPMLWTLKYWMYLVFQPICQVTKQVADSMQRVLECQQWTMALSYSPSVPPPIHQKMTKLELELDFFRASSQFPPNSEPLLSCYPAPTPFSFCGWPDCWIGAKHRIHSADKVNLNYCQDLI